MQIDMSQFPVVWMRDHDHDGSGEDSHEDEARAAFVALLAGERRFVVIVPRLPGLSDLAETSPDDRRDRARLFKAHKSNVKRLCAGMIVVGKRTALAAPLEKALSAFAAAFGVSLAFTENEEAAYALAQQKLAAT